MTAALEAASPMPRLKEMVQVGARALLQFPETILAALCLALLTAGFLKGILPNDDKVYYLVVEMIAASVFCSIAIKVLGWSWWKRFYFTGPMGLLLWWFYQTNIEHYSYMVFYQFVLQSAFLHLLVAIAPLLNKKVSDADFWHYNKSLFLRSFWGAILTGVLMAGVIGLLYAVKFVFSINGLEYDFFKWTMGISSVFSAWYFVSGVDEALKTDPRNAGVEAYPKVIKFLCQYLLLGILLAFSVVTMCYWVRLAMDGKIPAETFVRWGSPIAFATVFVVVMLSPLAASDVWVRRICRGLSGLLLPVVVLMLWALVARVYDMGWTVNRYTIVVACVWQILCCLYVLKNGGTKIRLIPSTLAVTAGLMLAPFTGTSATTIRSHVDRMKKAVAAEGVGEGAPIDLLKWKYENAKIFESSADYLTKTFPRDEVLKELGWTSEFLSDALRVRGTKYIERLEVKEVYRFTSPLDEIIRVDHPGSLGSVYYQKSSDRDRSRGAIYVSSVENIIRIWGKVGDRERNVKLPLTSVYQQVQKLPKSHTEQPNMKFVITHQGQEYVLYPTTIEFAVKKNGEIELTTLIGSLLIP